MDELTRRVYVDFFIGKTSHPIDNRRNAMCIRLATLDGNRDEVMRLIMTMRRDRLIWLTLVQRKWQGKTRNPNKANHHDSISIREQYVRTKG
jgi:hypothetical protein